MSNCFDPIPPDDDLEADVVLHGRAEDGTYWEVVSVPDAEAAEFIAKMQADPNCTSIKPITAETASEVIEASGKPLSAQEAARIADYLEMDARHEEVAGRISEAMERGESGIIIEGNEAFVVLNGDDPNAGAFLDILFSMLGLSGDDSMPIEAEHEYHRDLAEQERRGWEVETQDDESALFDGIGMGYYAPADDSGVEIEFEDEDDEDYEAGLDIVQGI